MIAEMWWKQNHGTNNKIQTFWELRGLNLKPCYEKKDLSHKMDQNDDSGVALSLLLMRISKLMMTVAKLLLLLLPVKLLPVQVTLKKNDDGLALKMRTMFVSLGFVLLLPFRLVMIILSRKNWLSRFKINNHFEWYYSWTIKMFICKKNNA